MDNHRKSARDDAIVELVADLLEEVYAANGLLADEIDRILGSRAAVSQSTIDRFTRLADRLQPGATARSRLSNLDPCLVLAGTRVWMGRNRERLNWTAPRIAIAGQPGEVPA